MGLFIPQLLDQCMALYVGLAQRLSYILAVYSHNDHYLDERQFARLIHPTLNGEPLAHKASSAINQIWYRSKAIADFVTRLKTEDPDALIVLMSDHLPAMSGTTFYDSVGYLHGQADAVHQVPAFVFDRGERVRLRIQQQYHLADLVFDLLSDGQYCQAFSCYQTRAQLTSSYYSIMSLAVKPNAATE